MQFVSYESKIRSVAILSLAKVKQLNSELQSSCNLTFAVIAVFSAKQYKSRKMADNVKGGRERESMGGG